MRVVSDKQISSLLQSLSKNGIKQFQDVLKTALLSYHKDPSVIPERIVIKRDDLEATHLFMPSFAKTVAIKTLAGSSNGFNGAVSIIDQTDGVLLGVLNAATLTAFRTALASTIPLEKFFETEKKDQTITVFGNGAQAYWHVRLTLSLYPSKFSTVQIAIRSINEKSKGLCNTLQEEFPDIKFELFDQTLVDLTKSSIIYGCVPSTDPQIKLQRLSKEIKTYISLIGSYKPHMAEVDNAVVQKALSNGKIIVDSYEHTLAEAGELIQGGVKVSDVVEIGELDSMTAKDINNNANLTLVKIVGLSIMDNCVGAEILDKALSNDIGTEVEF